MELYAYILKYSKYILLSLLYDIIYTIRQSPSAHTPTHGSVQNGVGPRAPRLRLEQRAGCFKNGSPSLPTPPPIGATDNNRTGVERGGGHRSSRHCCNRCTSARARQSLYYARDRLYTRFFPRYVRAACAFFRHAHTHVTVTKK